MNKGWTIFLVLATAATGGYLYYRYQKKAKPLIPIPALAPAVTTTPTWLEALKALVSPTPAVASTVAPTPAPTYKPPPATYQAPTPTNGKEPDEPKYRYTPVPAQEIPLEVRRLFRE